MGFPEADGRERRVDATSFVSLRGVSKFFGDFAAMAGIDLDIARGEFVTLLGPSGSGKTTTLMTIAGFIEPSGGEVLRDGSDISRLPAEDRNFGMVFQGDALFPHMTVERNVAYPLRVRRWPRERQRRAVGEALERVGLAAFAHRKPAELSGGQQQRVALARALVFEPEMLLLDEPLAALDKNLRKQLQVELKKIHRDVGKTFVFVTHDQEEALALSDRIAIFNQGRLEQIGSPQEVYRRPANRFVAGFLGETNLIPAEALESRAKEGKGRTLSVRPEHIIVGEHLPEDREGLKAVVKEQLFQGSHVQLSLAGPGDISLIARLDANDQAAVARTAPGQSCWLSWQADAGFVLPEK